MTFLSHAKHSLKKKSFSLILQLLKPCTPYLKTTEKKKGESDQSNNWLRILEGIF